MGGGCDSVGREVVVRIQSSANFYIQHLFTANCIRKTKIKKNRPGMADFLKMVKWEKFSNKG